MNSASSTCFIPQFYQFPFKNPNFIEDGEVMVKYKYSVYFIIYKKDHSTINIYLSIKISANLGKFS